MDSYAWLHFYTFLLKKSCKFLHSIKLFRAFWIVLLNIFTIFCSASFEYEQIMLYPLWAFLGKISFLFCSAAHFLFSNFPDQAQNLNSFKVFNYFLHEKSGKHFSWMKLTKSNKLNQGSWSFYVVLICIVHILCCRA